MPFDTNLILYESDSVKWIARCDPSHSAGFVTINAGRAAQEEGNSKEEALGRLIIEHDYVVGTDQSVGFEPRVVDSEKEFQICLANAPIDKRERSFIERESGPNQISLGHYRSALRFTIEEALNAKERHSDYNLEIIE